MALFFLLAAAGNDLVLLGMYMAKRSEPSPWGKKQYLIGMIRNNVIGRLVECMTAAADGRYVITDESTFKSSAKKAFYDNDKKDYQCPKWMKMKECLDAGALKIIIYNNLCYIRMDLDKFEMVTKDKEIREYLANRASRLDYLSTLDPPTVSLDMFAMHSVSSRRNQ